jgi:hypothetical protein
LSARDDDSPFAKPVIEEIQSAPEDVLLPSGKDSPSCTSTGELLAEDGDSPLANPEVIQSVSEGVLIPSDTTCTLDSPPYISLGESPAEDGDPPNAYRVIEEAPEATTSSDAISPSGGQVGDPIQDFPIVLQAESSAGKPSIEFQRPGKASPKPPIPAIPLSKLSDFFPTGERWDKRWEGESEADHKQRTSKQRSDWISWYTSTMKKGTTKAKKTLQFYQDLVKSGQQPQPFQKPQPVVTQGPSQLAIFERLSGDDWTLRWEGESEALWRDRYIMGKAEWIRHIERVMKSSIHCHKEKKKYYGHLILHQKSPVIHGEEPELEDSASIVEKDTSVRQQIFDAQAARDRDSWRKHTRKDVHDQAFEWMMCIRQGYNPPMPTPHYDEEWRNSWWLACWDQEYDKYKEEHQRISKLREIRRKEKVKADALAEYQKEARRMSNDELVSEILQMENLT